MGSKRNYEILDKIKIKPKIDYIQNYQSKWKEHEKRMNTGKIQKQVLLSAERTKINRTSCKEMGGKDNECMRPPGLILDRKKKILVNITCYKHYFYSLE
jgi:hypothetical protein